MTSEFMRNSGPKNRVLANVSPSVLKGLRFVGLWLGAAVIAVLTVALPLRAGLGWPIPLLQMTLALAALYSVYAILAVLAGLLGAMKLQLTLFTVVAGLVPLGPFLNEPALRDCQDRCSDHRRPVRGAIVSAIKTPNPA